MTITPLWSDRLLASFFEVLEQRPFWFYDPKHRLLIDKTELFRKFCPAIGIHNIPMDADDKGKRTLTTVFVAGNRVEPVSAHDIQDIIERLLELWDASNGSSIGDEVTVKLGLSNPFDEKGIRLVSKRNDIRLLRDTPTTAHLFFQNGWLEVTAEGTSVLKPYSDLPADKFIWNSSVIRRDFQNRHSVIASLDAVLLERKDPQTGEYLTREQTTHLHKQRQELLEQEEEQPLDTHFEDFLWNLSRDDQGEVDEGNLKRLKLSIGYLSHRCQVDDQRKWVLVVDRHIDAGARGSANGGNGKSVLVEALSNYLNTAFCDGREYVKGSSANKFAFSTVSPATDLVFFDDAAQDFDLKSLYSRTTGRFTVNRKHKDSFVLPKEDAPKLVITSNYAIAEDDSSTQRRNFLVEVSDFYKTQREEYGQQVKDFHGQKLIAQEGGGWTDADWSHFYGVIADCLSLYLKEGLPSQSEESDTFKRNRLAAKFPVENADELLDHFLRVLNGAVESGEEQFAQVFYRRTRKQFVFPEETTDRHLWEWLKDVGRAFGMNPNQNQRGVLKQERLTGDRLQRWKDAGMSDWVDKNGNNPLDLSDADRKCHTFKVSSLKNPATVGSKPDFSTPRDQVTEPSHAVTSTN